MNQIYIVDDNVEFAEFLATVARQEGWNAEVCVNGLDLLERLKLGTGPAFLLIDIIMPVLDGIGVIDGLIGHGRPLRMCFMTGGDDPQMIAAKMIANARDLQVGKNVYKPLRKEDFKALLRLEIKAMRGLADKNADPVPGRHLPE